MVTVLVGLFHPRLCFTISVFAVHMCAHTETVTCMGSADSLLPPRGFRMERRLSRSVDTPTTPQVFSLTLLLPLWGRNLFH